MDVDCVILVDTREVQPHDANEKEQLSLASVKAEPGSTGTTTTTTGTRLLHGILSQHPQQHGLGVQNGYGRHLAGHAQMGQPSYTTATIATTSTPGQSQTTFASLSRAKSIENVFSKFYRFFNFVALYFKARNS